MSDPTGPAGWFPDPHGRYEHRWYNGHEWTNDVATDGRRFVDTGGSPVSPTPARGRRAPGLASFILALCAVVLAWMPFFVVIGFTAAVVALVLGARAVRAGRATGRPASGFAVAGLVLGAIAVPLAGVGVWLSTLVWGEVQAFLEPGPATATVSECTLEGTVATATGVVTNLGDSTQGYTVTVRFVDGVTTVATAVVATTADAAPGADAPFSATEFVRGLDEGTEITCEVSDVRGPFPFGVEVNPPTSP